MALALIILTWPLLQSTFFPFQIAVVMLISWYSGRIPGLIAAVILGVGGHLLVGLLEPAHPLAGENGGIVPLLTFALVAFLISSLTAARRRAEAAERSQREWFEGTLSSLGEAVIATDLTGNVRLLNPTAETLTGWRMAEAFGKPLAEVYQAVDEESRKPALGPVLKVLQSGVAARPGGQSVLIARDGTERPIDHSASPLRNTRGSIIGMALVARDVTEQRLSAKKIKELRSSLSRRVKVLQTILDVSPMGIAVAEDRACEKIWLNPALQKMLRMPGEGNGSSNGSASTPLNYRVCRNGRELAPAELPMQVCTARGVPVRDAEIDFVLPDGTTFTVLNNVEPLFDDAGNVRGCLSFCTDITDRKRAEGSLRESEAFYRTLGEAVPDFVWTCDANGRQEYVNRRGEQYTGGAKELVRGVGWSSLVHPDDRAAYHERWQASLRTGTPFEMELRLQRADREYRWFMERAVPIRDSRELSFKWVGTSTDIDDRKRAEEARLRLAAIVESSDEAIVSTTLAGDITSWNLGAERVFGYSAQERMGQPIWMLVPPGQSDETRRILERIRDGEAISHYETIGRRKDGQLIDISLTVSPIRDSSGRVVGASKIARDITEKKRVDTQLREAKEAAEAANQAKDRFLAVLSHELRTPLTPVLLTVSSLLQDEAAPAELRSILEMIHRNVALEARLIDDLLDVMRIARGKMRFHLETVDAHDLIRQTAEICRADVHAGELTLTLDLSAEESHVQADPARLQQVFWNLLKNAVKFTPAGGTIAIRSRNVQPSAPGQSGARLIVQVIDSGIGIEPDFLPKVFDAFEQGERSPHDRKYSGLGLGLSISRSVVQALGGQLSVASAGKNRGSTFTLELDSVDVPAPAPAAAKPPVPPLPPASAMKILVVEDDPATLNALSLLLGRLRYRVTKADTIASALKAAAEDDFDLVISDLGLPDGNGYELMNQLRARRSLKGIALSGFGMDDDIRKSREAGFDEHLIKPIDFQTLEAAVQSLSERAE
jgi:PAS domain S-box-containing protein